MIINYKNFSMELANGTHFNLTETIKIEKSKRVNKKLVSTGEIGDKVINHGYAMPFEKCVELIINSEISKKNDTLDIKTYVKEYKAIKNEVLNILK
jgi:hypothetical protein